MKLLSGRFWTIVLWFLAVCCIAVSAQTSQTSDAVVQSQTAPVLSIEGDVPHPISLSVAELGKLPVTKSLYNDNESNFSFVSASLREVLKLAGVAFGEKTPKGALTKYLIVEDAEGNQVLFSLSELNTEGPNAGLAYIQDEKPINETDGPLRLVTFNEQSRNRWLTRVKRIIIKQAAVKSAT